MKLMIASDIHGSAYYCEKMIEAYKREKADKLLLLGDLLYHGPRNDLPKDYNPKAVIAMLNAMKEELLCVRGNCDTEVDQMVLEFPILADYCFIELDGHTIFATHGHHHNPANPPMLKKGDILVLAGSIPNTLPDDMYERIMERLDGRGIRIVVDATRELLTKVLPYHPFLIKPNHHELGEIFHVKLSDKAEIASYAKKLQAMGAGNVLVSMAGDGAVLVAEDGAVYECPAPRGKVVNSVGAGDSMVAGFLTGYLETGDYQEAFLRGAATGSASAFSEQLATREETEALFTQLKEVCL